MPYVPPWIIPPGRGDLAIVRALLAIVDPHHDCSRWDRRRSITQWVRTERIRSVLRLDAPAFAEALHRAEEGGLVATSEVGRRHRFPAVTLRRPALAMFGLFAGPKRRRIDAEELADLGGHAPLVAVVASYVSATPLVEMIADELRRDVDDLWGEIRSAEDAGWLSAWPDHPAGPSVTLSSATARRLRLRLSDDGSMWLRAFQPDMTRCLDPVELHGSSVDRDTDLSDPRFSSSVMDSAPDPAARPPLDWAGDDEDAEMTLARTIAEDLAVSPIGKGVAARWRELDNPSRPDHARRLPAPRFLVGADRPWPVPAWIEHPHGSAPGDRPWLVPWTPADGPCPECSGRDLGPLAYCIVCDRAGSDRLIEELSAVVAPLVPDLATIKTEAEVDRNGFTPAEVAAMSREVRRVWGYTLPRVDRSRPNKVAEARRDRSTLPVKMQRARRRVTTVAGGDGGLKGGLGA